jgi:hypothetical protein
MIPIKDRPKKHITKKSLPLNSFVPKNIFITRLPHIKQIKEIYIQEINSKIIGTLRLFYIHHLKKRRCLQFSTGIRLQYSFPGPPTWDLVYKGMAIGYHSNVDSNYSIFSLVYVIEYDLPQWFARPVPEEVEELKDSGILSFVQLSKHRKIRPKYWLAQPNILLLRIGIHLYKIATTQARKCQKEVRHKQIADPAR